MRVVRRRYITYQPLTECVAHIGGSKAKQTWPSLGGSDLTSAGNCGWVRDGRGPGGQPRWSRAEGRQALLQVAA